MKDQLLKICHEKLDTIKHLIENYESYYIDSQIDMWSSIPTTSQQCHGIGKFVKELGDALSDYELVGIGQTFIQQSESLEIEELKDYDSLLRLIK